MVQDQSQWMLHGLPVEIVSLEEIQQRSENKKYGRGKHKIEIFIFDPLIYLVEERFSCQTSWDDCASFHRITTVHVVSVSAAVVCRPQGTAHQNDIPHIVSTSNMSVKNQESTVQLFQSYLWYIYIYYVDMYFSTNNRLRTKLGKTASCGTNPGVRHCTWILFLSGANQKSGLNNIRNGISKWYLCVRNASVTIEWMTGNQRG